MHWRIYFRPNPSMVLGIELATEDLFLFWRWLCMSWLLDPAGLSLGMLGSCLGVGEGRQKW